jgi:hypothetical protein
MTKNQLWLLYCAKNPSFTQEGNVTLSSAGLKKLFDQTWEHALESVSSPKPEMPDFFKDIFANKV